ncbi:uncharacterized protein LTR77_000114 [Saxophila tyrrhenica]|uniref:Uncharacterized protein n=1 Tax=Saxophila tyrrhenica TaxID=1690608 RepID=A0AAV9PNV0_9PEZI|nr:hypothetical protein LTR77_000114 [Saxophila tyrrhenica]
MSLQYMRDVFTNKVSPPKDTRPSFKGRNVIVTGANVGLGYETALKFVQLGADKVVLACRSLSKGEEAKRRIDAQTKKPQSTVVWQLDMGNYDSIKDFAARANSELDHLDIACLNAGVMSIPFKQSDYGYEQTLQVNVLSTTYLALLLIPQLRASKTEKYNPVLEIVGSSNAYIVSKLVSETAPFAAYNKPENYSPAPMYNTSKLFVGYVEQELTALVANKETGRPDVFLSVVCPGACKSELGRNADAWYFKAMLYVLEKLVQRTAEEGARTYISGVDQAEKIHGGFWKNDEIRPPAPLMQGEKGKKLQQIVWKEVTDALARDVPEVRQLAAL